MNFQRYRSNPAVYGALLLLLLPLFSLSPAAEAAPRQDRIAIPEDTPIYVELLTPVTSRRQETARGDLVVGRVFRDVEVDGRVVVEEGAEVLLLVTDVQKARFFGRKSFLELEPTVVRAVDGTEIALQGDYASDGKGHTLATAALTVEGTAAPEGTVFQARVFQEAFVAPRPQVAEHSSTR